MSYNDISSDTISSSVYPPDQCSCFEHSRTSLGERDGPPTPPIPPFPQILSAPLTEAGDSALPEARRDTLSSDITVSPASPDSPPAQWKPVPESPRIQEIEAPDDGGDNNIPTPRTNAESEGGNFKEAVQEDAAKSLWKVWWLELACLLLSALLFAAIVVILQQLDQRDLPNWPLGITLNTLLAFLTAATKACFMIPVSTAISQTQWVWFSQGKPKPLYDLHLFDQASRGALGSLVLLWRLRLVRHFAALGALLVAVSAVTSPVTQLSINYPSRSTAVTGAREEAYTSNIYNLKGARDLLETSTGKAVSLAMLLDSSGFDRPMSFSTAATGREAFCSTGNCTFPRYQSVGVCMQMANVSSSLQVEEVSSADMANQSATTIISTDFPSAWRASLPGFEVVHQTKMGVFTGMLRGNETVAFGSDANLQKARLASFVVLYTTPTVFDVEPNPRGLGKVYTTREFRHDAAEVFFHLCVQTYETEVRMGVETTRVVDTLTEPVSGDAADGQPFLDMDCGPPLGADSRECVKRRARANETLAFKRDASDSLLIGSSDAGVVRADYQAMEDMASTLKWALSGITYIEFDVPLSSNARFASDIATEFGRGLFMDVFFGPQTMIYPERRQTCLTNIYTNIATACSATYVRSLLPGNTFVRSFHGVNGTAWKEVSYVEISWGWISMLAVEVVVAAVFVGLMIGSQIGDRESHRESFGFRDAKNSSLATLVVLGSDCQAAAGGRLRPVGELQRVAKGLKVRLERGQMVAAGDSESRL
ncbi:hypothetical protein CSOJ01_08826 [Colletotrichum sojae]|uniref:Uncharacterized protein n=1 Tax=Colletotrichum sojae TaxID=2175907 RepID=A0A8H6MSC4_9PEZI|nr:hypothetical protein CSOJ01_08826 [Colletotrichum sojae]